MKTKENSPANGANLREYSPAETHRRREIQVGQASRQPSTQARDGSPQPSQVSGATRRHPMRLPLKNRASRRSAPTSPPLRASAPPRELSLRSRSAFTLLEVLVATAVLALMMTFLFNLLGSSTKLWEVGNKKIEAAQAARVGLNIIASDLKNAFAGNMPSFTSTGNASYNFVPFLGVDNSDSSTSGTLSSSLKPAPGSDKIFGVLLTSSASNAFEQFDYQCVYVDDSDGFINMKAYHYYLVSQSRGDDFYFKSNNSTTSFSWPASTAGTPSPIIDNCIRVTFRYYGNQTSLTSQTSSNGTRSFTSNGTWPSNATTAHLPLGVLVTITVLDSNTAKKIEPPLTESDITAGINAALGLGTADERILNQRLIRQGSETMSRFIPFNAN